MASPAPEFLDQLERQFTELAADAPRKTPTRRLRLGLAIGAVGFGLAAAGAVAAVTGLIDISGDETAGLGGLADRGGIANGPAGPDTTWLLSYARSGSHPCLALKVESPARLIGTSEVCGGIQLGALHAGVAPNGDRPPLLYGTVPGDVEQVRISGPGGAETSAPSIEDQGNLTGRFFVVELPTLDPAGTELQLVKAGGEPVRSGISVVDLLRASSGAAAGPDEPRDE